MMLVARSSSRTGGGRGLSGASIKQGSYRFAYSAGACCRCFLEQQQSSLHMKLLLCCCVAVKLESSDTRLIIMHSSLSVATNMTCTAASSYLVVDDQPRIVYCLVLYNANIRTTLMTLGSTAARPAVVQAASAPLWPVAVADLLLKQTTRSTSARAQSQHAVDATPRTVLANT